VIKLCAVLLLRAIDCAFVLSLIVLLFQSMCGVVHAVLCVCCVCNTILLSNFTPLLTTTTSLLLSLPILLKGFAPYSEELTIFKCSKWCAAMRKSMFTHTHTRCCKIVLVRSHSDSLCFLVFRLSCVSLCVPLCTERKESTRKAAAAESDDSDSLSEPRKSAASAAKRRKRSAASADSKMSDSDESPSKSHVPNDGGGGGGGGGVGGGSAATAPPPEWGFDGAEDASDEVFDEKTAELDDSSDSDGGGAADGKQDDDALRASHRAMERLSGWSVDRKGPRAASASAAAAAAPRPIPLPSAADDQAAVDEANALLRAFEDRADAERRAAAEREADRKDTIWGTATTPVRPYAPPALLPDPTFPVGVDYGDAKQFPSPLAFFRLFFNSTVMENLRLQTDLNRTERGQEVSDDGALNAMFGALLIMGIVRADSLRTYWDPALGPEAVRSVWSRDKFLDLWHSFTPFAGAKPADPSRYSDRFWVVDRFVADMNIRFAAALVPGGRLTIDETMIKFRGKHPSVQEMPRKPIRIGFKAYSIGSRDGYIFRELLYRGKSGNPALDKGHTTRVIFELLDGYLDPPGGGYRLLTTDSYYTSVPLAKSLIERRILLNGAFHPIRSQFPKDLKKPKERLERYESRIRQAKLHDGLLALMYVAASASSRQKNRPSLYVSTATAVPVEFAASIANPDANMPQTVSLYNNEMSGIDIANKYAAKNSPWRRARRWFVAIFLHYFHVAVVNAFLLYSWYGAAELPTMNFGAFTRALATALMEGFTKGRAVPGRPPALVARQHNIAKFDGRLENDAQKRGLCKRCAHQYGARGEQQLTGKKTMWVCTTCSTPAHPYWICGFQSDCWRLHSRSDNDR
jgi:hypothetical protein